VAGIRLPVLRSAPALFTEFLVSFGILCIFRIVKLYRVILDDRREEDVVADSYMLVEGSFHFFANGRPIPDVFFREDSVKGINVLSDNYDRDSRWRGGGSY